MFLNVFSGASLFGGKSGSDLFKVRIGIVFVGFESEQENQVENACT